MDPRVTLIIQVIATQKATCPLSAKAAGNLLGLSEGHFLRLFRREKGTTFRRYRREARIAAIIRLLRDNAASVKQIAGIAGYGDVSNFHRDFKQVQGMSPRQWRLMEFSKMSQSFKTPQDTSSDVIVVPDDQAA